MSLKPSRHVIWISLATGLVIVAVLTLAGRTNEPSRRTASASPSGNLYEVSVPTTAGDPDASLRESLLGSWRREFYGEWVMTVHEGGQGTMVIRPSGIWSTLIGEQVNVDLAWSVENGRANLRSVSGKPDLAFAAAIQIFGKERIRKIKELTAQRLILLDEEDGSEAEWTRVGNP